MEKEAGCELWKRLKYKLIVNGIVLTKQDEATIDKFEQH